VTANRANRKAFAKCRTVLESLPDTPDGIAARLRELDVTGIPGRSRSCALAAFLKQQTGRQWDVWIGGPDAYFAQLPYDYGLVELAAPVRYFVNRFDDRAYPDLIRED
jgi:hypothetical protein